MINYHKYHLNKMNVQVLFLKTSAICSGMNDDKFIVA